MDRLTRAYERYMNARELAAKYNMPVPTEIMREYLDEYRSARKTMPGMHEVKIVVTRDSSTELINMFRKTALKSDFHNVQLEVRS